MIHLQLLCTHSLMFRTLQSCPASHPTSPQLICPQFKTLSYARPVILTVSSPRTVLTLVVSRGGEKEGGTSSLCPGLQGSYKGPTLNRTVTLLSELCQRRGVRGPPSLPQACVGACGPHATWAALRPPKGSFAFALKPITRAPRTQRKEMENKQTAKGKNFTELGQMGCPVSPSLSPHQATGTAGKAPATNPSTN